MIVAVKYSRLPTILTIIIISLAFVYIFLPSSRVVKAENQVGPWSWTDNDPVVAMSKDTPRIDPGYCPDSYQLKEVDGEGENMLCMTSGDDVRFGLYSFGAGLRVAVGFRYDTKMYRVNMDGINNPCVRFNDCLYLPDSDTLVTKQYLINNIVQSLVVYKNFSLRVKPVVKVGVTSTLGYSFDSSNPDYVLQNSGGYKWPVGGMGASKNGDWLAVEFRSAGIGLLDINSLEMKRISISYYQYGRGYDPTSELAVSNDGAHVALMGLNSWISVYDISSVCGDGSENILIGPYIDIATPCAKANIYTEGFIHRFKQGMYPKFSNDGGELNFYANSYIGEWREVTLRANGYNVPRLDYLAMGDSFSSGEGEDSDSYYLNGTNDEYEKCHVSSRSYPFLVAELSGIDPNYVESVACSGAVTGDVIGDEASYLGQGKRLGPTGLNLDDINAELSKNMARNYFVPGLVRQERFVEGYKPAVITIGIGGNDAGLMEKLKACVALSGTCGWAGNDQKREQTAIEIQNLFSKLVDTYRKLHDDSPNSKIFAIGYPKIINGDKGCGSVPGDWIDSIESKFMNESVTYLNQVIAAAAKSAGIKYVDIEDSLGDSVLCGGASPSSMNSFRWGDDSGLTKNADKTKFIGQESFHPNSLGHFYEANSIYESTGNILAYDYCQNGSTVCPDETVKAPEPSAYWMPSGNHNYPVQLRIDCIYFQSGYADSINAQIRLSGGSLQPGSSVSAEIHSTTRSLGQFTAASDGSLDVGIVLPTDLEEGYHTIDIYGTSYSGESIDIYQIIDYKKPYVKPYVEPAASIVSIHQDVNNTTQSDIITIKPNTTSDIAIDYNTAKIVEQAVLTSKSEVKGDSIVLIKPFVGSSAKSVNTTRTGWDMRRVFMYILIGIFAIFITVFIAYSVKHRPSIRE